MKQINDIRNRVRYLVDSEIPIKKFRGDYYEIGKKQGKFYKSMGLDLSNIVVDKSIYKKQLSIYKRYYPGMLEEINGIADGGNFDVDKLTFFYICQELLYTKNKVDDRRGCTVFGFKKGKKLYVGRNFDAGPVKERVFEIYKIINPDTNNYLSITDVRNSRFDVNNLPTKPNAYIYYADDVINDKGLFIEANIAYLDEWAYGISTSHITKLIIERCETVKEAIALFRKIPICSPKHFFFADRFGDMAVVEHTSKEFKVIYPKDNILIHTNHFIDKDLAKKDMILKKYPIHNSFLRYYEVIQYANYIRNVFDIDSVVKVLCRKGSNTFQRFLDYVTVYTLALEITNKEYRIYWEISGKYYVQKISI